MDLRSVLDNLLSSDNSARQQAEVIYSESLKINPSEVILSMLQFLPSSSSQIKILIPVLLKQLVDPLSSKEIWNKLNPQAQKSFKTLLLESLINERDSKSIELLCEVAGKLISNIYSMNQEWKEIVEFVKQGLVSERVLASLEILGKIYVYAWKEISLSPEIFASLFSSQNLHLKFSALKALNSVISIMKKKSAKKYSALASSILSSCFSILTADEYVGAKSLNLVREIAENGKVFTDEHLMLCYEFTFSALQLNISTSNKLLCAEIIICLYENSVEPNDIISEKLLEDIFKIMISCEYSYDEEWQSPQEGFAENEETVEIDYAKIGRKLINRLLESAGDSILLPSALKQIHKGLSESDWKSQYSALMTLGELVSYLAEPTKIAEIIPICTSACSSNNCKVRYAGYTLITDLSIDYVQEFQASYHSTIFPVILSGCHDLVPRVRAQALASLTGFIEGAGNKISSGYCDCIPYLVSLFHNQISLVVEYAVTSVSAFAKSTKFKFIDYYQNVIDELLGLFARVSYSTYDNLRGKIVESISLCSSAVGKQMFATKIHLIIQAITSFEVSPDQEVVSYLLNSWQVICELLQEDFSEYLDNIVPYLLKFISSPNEGFNVNTTEVINKEHALQTISIFVNTLKGKYWKYLDDTLRAALALVNYTLNDSLRATAAEILAGLVQAKKSLQDPNAMTHSQELARVFLSLLLKAVKEEFNKDALIAQLEAIAKILNVIGMAFLSQKEVNEISEHVVFMILEKAKKGYNSDDENIYIEITEVIGSILKSHPYFTSHLLSLISSQIIPKLLHESKEKNFHKYVLFIIDDAIEFLSSSHSTTKWDELLSILLCYAADADDGLRQAAVYGLGVYSQNSAEFEEKASIILSALFCSLDIPSKRIKTYGFARDNSISAIAKVIKYQSQTIDLPAVVERWIKLLPLKWDKAEAVLSHELLADLLEMRIDLVIAQNKENFLKVLQIIGDVFQTKYVNAKTVLKFKNFLIKYNNETETVWNELTSTQQERIKTITLSA